MPNYLVMATDWDFGQANLDIEQEELAKVGARVVELHCQTEDDVIALATDADALMVKFVPITHRVLSVLPRCKAVCRAGTGYDNIDVEAASELGVNAVFSPHAAYYSEDSLEAARRLTARFVARALAGEVPDGLLNPQILATTAKR